MRFNRNETLAWLRGRPGVPVLIIGGGINGAGTLRDLAVGGVPALLAERGDFSGGASAASSHMLHGGIRYLENGEFRLVREAVQERNRLLRLAPDDAQPLPTVIPIFTTFSGLLNAPLRFLGLRRRPAERGALVIRIGLAFYDAFAGRDRVTPRGRMLGREEALRRFPRLNADIRAAALYYDALMPTPERLCMKVLLDGLAAHPEARAVNYLEAIGVEGRAVRLRDAETGEEFMVEPGCVVNAAGPWIDRANAALGLHTAYIGGTKGSHIVLDHPGLMAAIDGHEFFFENADGRIVLICPLHDRTLVGTSDIRIEDPDAARCTPEEEDYFVEMLGRVFPEIGGVREGIVFRFSGVRPLPRASGRTGEIPRDHSIQVDDRLPFPVFSLVGGKWTTFRAFGEQAADAVLARLGLARAGDTCARPLPGGGLGVVPDDDEIRRMCREEAVVHLDDLALRRTLLGMLGRLDGERMQWLARVAGAELGWDARRQNDEMERLAGILRERHGANLLGA
ncbi:MAG: glycerol-3-phosphate dehydrogenase/oxidase [Chloroflexi bacterium]|nr:glycerol-3-phosphate dehydrogenase/oxidase [Chloroflexota bacterium]